MQRRTSTFCPIAVRSVARLEEIGPGLKLNAAIKLHSAYFLNEAKGRGVSHVRGLLKRGKS